MNKDIHLHYTEDLTKLSVLYYCWALTGKLFALTYVLVGLSLVFLIKNGGSSMIITISALTLLIVPLFLGLLYYISRKRALAKFRSLKDGKAIFGITDDHFSLIGTGVTSTLPWSSITKIKQYPDFWIILLRPRGYFTLPLQNLLPEDKEFILKKTPSQSIVN